MLNGTGAQEPEYDGLEIVKINEAVGQYRIITGEIINSGEHKCENARVAAAYLNSNGIVIDVATQEIGTLLPGDSKPITIQAINDSIFDNFTGEYTLFSECREL